MLPAANSPACVCLCGVYAGISTLPPGLGELRALEGLQAEGCPLLPPYANMYGKDPLLLVALHDREQLSLDLSDCGLSEMPADLQQQTQLTSLNLGKNSITDLPTWLGNLRRLRQLTVKGNPLHQPYARCGLCCMPPSHSCCARLHNEPPRGQSATSKQVTRLSASMRLCRPAVCAHRLIDARGELAVLALLRPEGAGGTLDLSSCSFETLPAIVWELPGRASSLQELHLPNNRLWTLPEVTGPLRSARPMSAAASISFPLRPGAMQPACLHQTGTTTSCVSVQTLAVLFLPLQLLLFGSAGDGVSCVAHAPGA